MEHIPLMVNSPRPGSGKVSGDDCAADSSTSPIRSADDGEEKRSSRFWILEMDICRDFRREFQGRAFVEGEGEVWGKLEE